LWLPLYIYIMGFFCSTGAWTQGLTLARQAVLLLEPLHQPFFYDFFYIGSHGLFCLGLATSWVAGITDVSHWCPATILYFCSLTYTDKKCRGCNSIGRAHA
jgi:hypothetical protein